MEILLVLLISLCLAVLTDMPYILGVIHTPPGMVYLGVTHYWEDYFAYISQVMQGTNGIIIAQDLYTTERVAAAPLYWVNILLGHISRMTHIDPIPLFHGSVFLLAFLVPVAAYLLYRRIFPKKQLAVVAFLFFVFSTSLQHKLPPGAPAAYWPFELGGTPHFIFNRITNLPHHLVQTLLFLAILFLLFDDGHLRPWIKRIAMVCCITLLTLLQPVMTGMVVGIYICVTLCFRQRNWDTIISMLVGFCIPFVMMIRIFRQEPYIQLRIWENAQQVQTTTAFLLLSIGPIIPFACVGMWHAIKKRIPLEFFGLLLVLFGYIVFRFPILDQIAHITNVRVISSGTFIFLAWFAAVGVSYGSSWIAKRIHQPQAFVASCCLAVFLLAVAPSAVWEIQHKVSAPHPDDPFTYIPVSTMDAFSFLRMQTPYTDVVLGNPQNGTNVLIPALTGHVGVSGHQLLTIHPEEKTSRSSAFFLRAMDGQSAIDWLRSERVTYVLVTDMDGSKKLFEEAYPFLRPLFSTGTATVFEVIPRSSS